MSKRIDRYNVYSDGTTKHIGFSENGKSYTFVEDRKHKTYKVKKSGKKKLISESFNDSTFVYDNSSKLSRFKFENILHLILVFSLSIFFFSWGSKGFIDSKYTNAKKDYTYQSYDVIDGVVQKVEMTDIFYDYDWTYKLNQLGALRNVFTIPDVNSSIGLFTNDNMAFMENMRKYSILLPAYMDSSKYQAQLNLMEDNALKQTYGGYLVMADLQPLQDAKVFADFIYELFNPGKQQTKVMKFNNLDNQDFIEELLADTDVLKYMSYGEFVNKCKSLQLLTLFCYEENGQFKWDTTAVNKNKLVNGSADDYSSKSFFKTFLTVLSYPFVVIANTTYDIGVFFNFLLNW